MSGAAESAPKPAAPAHPTPPSRGPVEQIVNALSVKIRDPNPILVKELRSTFRTNLFIRFLYLSVGVIAVIVLGGGAMVAAGPLPPAKVGQVVFQIFFGMALLVISLVAPAYASTSITGEREQKTYESLILSGMPSWRIIRGKFIAAYASMFLVIVAIGPVVGIAFLFGGISPGQVIFGFLGLLLVLAPAVALGVAVSARVASTRIAILIATIVFFPTAMFVTTMVGVLGEPAGDEWSLGMEGPFWWTEALTEHFFDPRIFGLLVALPLYVFLMPVWLFLASAVAGIRPPAEDRSTPFKWWSVVAVLGMLVIVGFMPLLINDPEGATVGGVVYGLMGQSLLLFIALIFMNEPPLPPRLFAQRMKESRLGFIGRAIGPGAAPTLRFATALIVVTSVGMAILPALTRHLYWPTWTRNGEGDLSLLILAAGNISVCFFFLSFGVWLRVMLRNGVAARVLAIASIMTAAILPFLFAVIVDPSSFDNLDEEIPFFIQLSPNAPSMVAGAMAAGEMHAEASLYSVLSVLMYAAFGGIFWVLVEVRCAKVQRIDEERRVKRDERARTSEPNAPLLTRGSRPSLASAIAARTEAQTRPFPPNEKAPPERSGAAGSRSGAEAQRSAGGAGSAGPFAEGAGRAEAAAPNAPAIAADWQGSTEAFELTREKDGQETLESGSKSETETESATATPTPRDFAADDADAATEVDPEASVDDEEIEP